MCPRAADVNRCSRIRAYPGRVTSNPPTGEPEPRWQQPPFQAGGPTPYDATPDEPTDTDFPAYGASQPPVSGYVVPAPGSAVPPPSQFETVVVTLARLIWPVAFVLVIFTGAGFWPVLIGALNVNTILRALKGNLRQRRRALGTGYPRPPYS